MSFDFQCPYCNTTLEAEDDWIGMDAQCPQCQKNIFIIKQPNSNNNPAATPVPVATAVQEPRNANNNMVVYQVAEGKFNITGDYSSVWEIVLQTMAECKVTVKQQNFQSGRIVGSCKYGINPFGMTVLAFLNYTERTIYLEFRAQFSDAFDNGACLKKVQTLSAKFMDLCPTNLSNMQNIQYNNGMQYSTPNGMQYGTPNGMQYGTPNSMQYGTPNSMQYGTPNGMQYGTPNSMQYGMGANRQFKYKNPVLAGVLSFFIIGLGQMYNGQVIKGIIQIFCCILLFVLLRENCIFVTWIISLMSIIDAVRYAKQINSGL